MTEIFVSQESLSHDEVRVRFDFDGPVHRLTRDGLSVAPRATHAGDLVWSPGQHDELLAEHERELDEAWREQQDAVEEAREQAEDTAREEALDRARTKIGEAVAAVVDLPEVTALLAFGAASRDVLVGELIARLEETL